MWTDVKNDVVHIAARIKQINPKYVLFRNMATGKAEVHSSVRPSARSLEFIVPYDELDERTLEYARKTRVENFDAIEAEQTAANAALEAAAKRNAQKSASVLGDMMNYAAGQVEKVVFQKNKRWF